MKENYVETETCKAAKAAGWAIWKLMSPGHNGFPDRLFVKEGRAVFMEMKRPGKEPRPNQRKELEKLKAAGADVYSVDTVAEACEILGIQ